MRFIFIFLLFSSTSFSQENPISLNQEGFFANGIKKAVLSGRILTDTFYVVNLSKNDTVFIGRPGDPISSRNSTLVCRIMEFSAVSKPGQYYIYVPGIGNSYIFPINNQPLKNTAISSLKGFYFQRVSVTLEPQYAGQWARPAGHPDNKVEIHPSAATAKRPAGTIISSPGGWYDAGDYNKYIVNSGITMGTLLSAYEDFPAYFDSLKTIIPESGNKLPDIIDEIIVNLRWMLTMQDPDDGGVYHKCTNASFDGMVMPGVTKLPRYVVQKSTAATLDFSAVTSQASRILKKFSKLIPGLADSCRKASIAAYDWAILHNNVLYEQNAMNKNFKPEVTTGAYGDGQLWDEWAWASAELFITTKEQRYADKWKSIENKKPGLASWSNVAMAGILSLIRNAKSLPSSFSSSNNQLRQYIISFADSLINNESQNAFGTVMGGSRKDFEWGSNAVASNQGIVCINAYLISKDKKYLEAALSNADYILGRNATGYCFLTGAGTRSTRKPHHRPSFADGISDPVPGLLAGGPNPGKQDKCNYAFSEPETTYLDEDCSYASNEIAINWNAPLVYLLNGLNYLYH
jgi:endoglucanase